MAFSTRTLALLPALAALSSSVQAFQPAFSIPKQCGALTLSWSSFEITEAAFASSISVSLVPLESAAHHAPEPFTFDVLASDSEFTISSLPFRQGTQFFASAYIPASAGPVRRRVSEVLTVGRSTDSSCLNDELPAGRFRKTFGRRQINEVGVATVGEDQLSASPSSSSAAAGPTGNVPIRVVGESSIPANGEVPTPENAVVAPPPAAQSSGGVVPPIREVGLGSVPEVVEGVVEDAAAAEDAPTTTFFAPEPVYTDAPEEAAPEYEYGYDEAAPEYEYGYDNNYGEALPEESVSEEHFVPEYEYVPEDEVHDELPQNQVVGSLEYPEPNPWAVEFYHEGRIWDYDYVPDVEEQATEVEEHFTEVVEPAHAVESAAAAEVVPEVYYPVYYTHTRRR